MSAPAEDAIKECDIRFDVSKRETFHPKSNFKRMYRKLRASYKCQVNKDDIESDWLSKTRMLVLGNPQMDFSQKEVEKIKSFVREGGSLLVTLAEGGCTSAGLRELLQSFGATPNADAVVGTAHYKSYHHPKEVLIHDAIVSGGCRRACADVAKEALSARKAGKASSKQRSKAAASDADNGSTGAAAGKLDIAYPYGCTVVAAAGATPILSSGHIAFPMNSVVGVAARPPAGGADTGVGKENQKEQGKSAGDAGKPQGDGGKGRVVVLGSSHVFGDEYLSREDNTTLLLAVTKWLLQQDAKDAAETDTAAAEKSSTTAVPPMPPACQLDSTDGTESLGELQGFVSSRADAAGQAGGRHGRRRSGASAPKTGPLLQEQHRCPDTESLAERLRPCMQEIEDGSISSAPGDFLKLFDDELFRFGTKQVPETIKLYATLGMKHEPLGLIPPQFESPLPPFSPAVLPPALREAPGPALDQYDLDQEFASDRIRLARLTNKCTEEDLEYYVRECGEVLGVSAQLPAGQSSAKHVLDFVLRKLIAFKKLEHAGAVAATAVPDGMASADCRPSTAEALNAGVQMQMPDYRPDTASAIRAAMEQDSGMEAKATAGGAYDFGQGAHGDYRPDTAAAIRAVSEFDARPDTAAAIAAVAAAEEKY